MLRRWAIASIEGSLIMPMTIFIIAVSYLLLFFVQVTYLEVLWKINSMTAWFAYLVVSTFVGTAISTRFDGFIGGGGIGVAISAAFITTAAVLSELFSRKKR
ncbi:hypothetical protein S7335_1173 [Synechococcus sp. PCC 7335]|uniref:hypothetical protein n=1 Tax=Synechococcus sp. (strain ATCC 29403 / PCC 7335) TaxID=91464 RepID=UPI00017EE13A|nr:hypothetical protein [Synechococcus sp. PCC 7335]EDX82469.1 hypothetical protein S7335_1173 [Synechococcus sp. PCC 7335]